MTMETTRFEPFTCGSCGYVVDAATHLDGKSVPVEGDLSCCLKCAAPSIFRDGRLAMLTDDELIALSVDEKRTLSYVQKVIREFNKTGQGPK